MKTIKTDICVIGGGSGGLSVAAGAVQMGARVVLIEGGKMGGDCLNYGCVPSKALIAVGKQAYAMTSGAQFGVKSVKPVIDFNRAKDHVAETVAAIAPHDSVERFEGLGVQVLQDYGRFIGPDTVQAGDTVVKARRFVIATGSSPFVPPIPGLEDVPYDTNEDIFESKNKPEHLLVIGGGPIGLEMAQAHLRLGCAVTVLEGAKALGKDDPELAAIALENLRAEGMIIVEGALAEKITGSDGDITVHTEDGTTYQGTHLFMAVGRKPNVDKLNLEAAGIAYDRPGISVDAALKTSNKKVYAIGDVSGGLQFTHVAGYQAGIVIRSAVLGMRAKAKYDHIPWATYIDPEMAQVGLTEAQAQDAHGAKLQVYRFDYDGNDRSVAEGKTRGRIKLMAVKGRPVGVSIVGAMAGELIQPWALVMANNLKVSAVANMVAPYPTVGEINKRVAGMTFTSFLFENPWLRRLVRLVQRF
jgi:pyruvate/2-oxoglutarate dehydrogenase complex dihydrolipoamide dehydrogenase (E3) component